MIPILYDKVGNIELGKLNDILGDEEYFVEEERNGVLELVFSYPNGYPLADQLIEENLIEVKPNDEQGNQRFRIYETKKFIDNIIEVHARHESFDLANDHVENINLENASCEYALNALFRNSHFSKDFRGYSDIVNAQDYKIDNVNILNAIAGKEGSIIDTYGTGAEILRDGKNIHVLNKRGRDNGVTIEYGKNLTGFELTVDLEGLETRCGGFAKYKLEGSQEEIIVKSDWIDSLFIENFAHPYISVEGRRDYSDKFKDGVVPTKEALNKLCQDEFKINKRDIPANNYKINFIPLSKCVGYESIEDKISLCDTVTIIDPRFNINTKAKVIKYKYDFIKERYISMELGEPRTTLGDIIGNGGKGEIGPPGPPGKDGADGNIGDFPNSLPTIPILTATVKGFDSIDLSWTYEDKVYYTYEVYASKTKDFKPNTFDLIHEGQTSSFLFKAKPGETWYFRVCAKNTHGDRTDFSPQVTVTTNKADNFDEYFSSLAVGSLVANIFSADYMEAGIIKGSWIDAKQLSVTDGNGKRTLDIDSFGNINADFSSLTLRSQRLETSESVQNRIENIKLGVRNLVLNSDRYLANSEGTLIDFPLVEDEIKRARGKEITLSFDIELVDAIATAEGSKRVGIEFWTVNTEGITTWYGCWIFLGEEAKSMNKRVSKNIQLKDETIDCMGNLGLYIQGLTSGTVRAGRPKVEIGTKASEYTKAFEDTDENINVAYNRLQTVEERTTPDGIVKTVKEHKTDGRSTFVTGTEFLQTKDDFQYRFENSGKPNELINSDFSELFRGWKTAAYDADIWVDYNSSFAGVETVGCHAVYMGLWNENSSCWAMQRFKPRNPRMINFTIGGCYHYDDVRIEREEPYPMAFIYVVITNKDGTEEYYNQDDVLDYGPYINWVTYQRTFGRSGKEIDYIDFYVYKRSTTGKFRITNLDFHEGTEHRKWRPSGEIYSNTTKIDGEGIEIIHDNGSKSRLSHEKIEFTASNGNATLRIKDGGLNMFTATNNEMCGFIKPSQIIEDTYNGVSVSTYGAGDYITLGHSDSTDETSWSSLPSILIAKNDNIANGQYYKGTNIVNQPIYFRTKSYVKSGFEVDKGRAMYFSGGTETPNKLYGHEGGHFYMYADNVLHLGIQYGTELLDGIRISEVEGSTYHSQIQMWGDVFSYKSINLMNTDIKNSLPPQSMQLKAKRKFITDTFVPFTMTEDEIRYTHTEEILMNERNMIVELPQLLAENIRNNYHVNIGKVSWGDYRIVEKTPYYFEIESNVECFKFTYEIVARKIEKAKECVGYAGLQYSAVGQVENPSSDEDGKVVHQIDSGQVGKGSFWKMYTNDFLRANISNKTLKFTSPS